LARRSTVVNAARSWQHWLPTLVAQFDALEVVPDALVRIELGGVSGQLLEMQAARRAPAQEVLHGLAAVDRRPIPDDQQLAAHLA
jgi:hypothetical protein